MVGGEELTSNFQCGASGGGITGMDEMCTPDLAKILTFYGMYFALGMS